MARYVIETLAVFSILTLKCGGANHTPPIAFEREAYAAKMDSYMDKSVDPCADFYQYACGNFSNVHKIKPGQPKAEISSLVTEELYDTLDGILTEPYNSDDIMVFDKAKLFYRSCMREDIFRYPGSEAYLGLINSLGGWPALDPKWSPEQFDWFNWTAALASYGIDVFFKTRTDLVTMRIEKDRFTLDGLSLSKSSRRSYNISKGVIEFILRKYGVSKRASKAIFKDIEEIRKKWKVFSKRHEGKKRAFTVATLKRNISNIDWDKYFLEISGESVSDSFKVEVKHRKYLRNLEKFFAQNGVKNKLQAVANYVIVKLLFGLHTEYRFPQYKLKFCIEKLNEVMRDVLSAMYIHSKYYQESVASEVKYMTKYTKAAFKSLVRDMTWMNGTVNQKVRKKISNMNIIIGDAEKTLDPEKLEKEFRDFHIGPDSNFYGSYLKLRQLQRRREVNQFRKADDERYQIDVNAYYKSHTNTLLLPAGIIRRPYFSPKFPRSYNFGALGASVIGHEMTHAFDPIGIKYGPKGQKNPNWGPAKFEHYNESVKCFQDQYSSYKISEINEYIDGTKSVSENIADNGGLRQGYYGYKKWLNAHKGYYDAQKETFLKLNLTNFQLFFLAYAQTYCGHYSRRGFLIHQTDVHIINKYRVIGSLSNFDEFGKAFNCKLGDNMSRVKKCVLW